LPPSFAQFVALTQQRRISLHKKKEMKQKQKRNTRRLLLLWFFFLLVDALRLAHGCLDVRRLQVLPVLLQEGDQEVECHHGVVADLVLVHLSVSDASTEAQNLLQLELDGGLELKNLLGEVIGLGDGSWELTSTVHVGSDQTGDGLDDRLGAEEGIVLVA